MLAFDTGLVLIITLTFDAGLMAHGGEAQRFHLDITDARAVRLFKERHLVVFGVTTEGAV